VFISNAYAQAAGPAVEAGGIPGGFMTIFAIMFAVMYFFMIRPQQKKAKEAQQMVEALKKGDEVVTSSGILGRVVKVKDTYVTIEIATNTEVVFQKQAIAMTLPTGTLKSL
jgi:preprotein translocase subunit YajC